MVKLAMFAAGISPEWTPPPQKQVYDNDTGTVKTKPFSFHKSRFYKTNLSRIMFRKSILE